MLYNSPFLYQCLMRFLYGRHYEARYACLADEIPAGSSVVEICAGDGYLYRKYLYQKSVKYLALDLSPSFVSFLGKLGVPARLFNLWNDPVPPANFFVMQASLYQFLPHPEPVVEKLLAAANHKVILSEPVENLSTSKFLPLAFLSRRLTAPGSSQAYTGSRFTQDTLMDFFFQFPEFERAFRIPGKREVIGIFGGRGQYER